jgi:hypothetical protein
MCFLIFVSSNRDVLMYRAAHGVNAEITQAPIRSHAIADFDAVGG